MLIPADLEQQKIVDDRRLRRDLVAVDGTYDDVNRLASELAGEHEDWAFVNVNVRPYYAEGSKTLGYEIAEQLGWRLPDQIVVPIASGSQLTKIDKAFRELITLGLVEDQPYKMFGAQATGCSPVSRPFKAGHDVVQPVQPSTRSPSRWPSATRPTARTSWTMCAAPAAPSRTSPTTEVVERDAAAGPHRGHLRARPRAASPWACCASCSPPGCSTRAPRPSSSTPATA